LNVNDTAGGELAKVLMPNQDWSEIRNRGEIPFARGLVERAGMQDVLNDFDPTSAKKLREAKGFATIVMDFGVVEVFP
jgi:hypothetical protein